MAHAFILNPLEEGCGMWIFVSLSLLSKMKARVVTQINPVLTSLPTQKKKKLARVNLLGVEYVQNVLY